MRIVVLHQLGVHYVRYTGSGSRALFFTELRVYRGDGLVSEILRLIGGVASCVVHEGNTENDEEYSEGMHSGGRLFVA
jgi:hypothetical protein